MLAHHSFDAEFDSNKPITITGVVTKLDWINPHAYVYLDSKTPAGEVKRFKVEMGPPYALVRGGWKRDTLKIGDTVTVEGAALRQGRQRLRRLDADDADAAGQRPEADHEVDVQSIAQLAYVCVLARRRSSGLRSLLDRRRRLPSRAAAEGDPGLDSRSEGLLGDQARPRRRSSCRRRAVPALGAGALRLPAVADRSAIRRSCAASRPVGRDSSMRPASRSWTSPELQRVFILNIAGPHSWRVIYMDGRAHPDATLAADVPRPLDRHDGTATRWSIDTVGLQRKAVDGRQRIRRPSGCT